MYQKPRVLAAAVAASLCAVYWTRTSFKLPTINRSPASANLSSSQLCIRLVSRCCSLVAAGSNGHSSEPQSRIVCLRRSLVTVSVCTIFKVKKKNKKKNQKTVDRWRMCFSGSVAKVQCQMEALGVSWRRSTPQAAVQSGKELMVSPCSAVGLSPTLTPAELWVIWTKKKQKKNWVNWVKSALNSPTNRSHHVTRVRRRRIKHLYEVLFNKKRSTFVKTNDGLKKRIFVQRIL